MGRLENLAWSVWQDRRAHVEGHETVGDRSEKVGRGPTILGLLCCAKEFGFGWEVAESC